jgi:hypothetical protein
MVRFCGVARALLALALLLGIAALPSQAPAAATDDAALIARAYEYGFPIFEQQRLAYLYSYFPGNPQRVPVNSFGHRRRLVDHTARTVTTPNNDTLYSSAIIDLSAGPLRLDVPDFGDRYFSIAFLDAYTNNFAYLGTRVNGGRGGAYLIAGPGAAPRAQRGTGIIRAPGNHIVAIVRILVDGPQDYDEVHRLQDGLRLTQMTPLPERKDLIAPKAGDAENFVAVVNQVLHDNPPPRADAPVLKELAAAGIGPLAKPLTPAQRALWQRYYPAAETGLLAKDIGEQIRGWGYWPANIGNFGTDYRTRAVVALRGIGANVPEEMHYAVAAVDAAGRKLDGDHRYVLHLPADSPPADGFWSISIYEVTPEGALFFGDNPIHRYAIGDRTQGLKRNADGSLDILIQKERPGPDAAANWLPVPAKSFALVARAYLPRAPLLRGQFRYPGIIRAD